MAKAPETTRRPRNNTPKAPRKNGAGVTTRATDTGLPPAQEHFVLTYLANGFNGTRAYLEAHPGVTYNTAAVEAHKLLKLPNVKRAIADRMAEAFAAVEMKAGEALARISLIARSNLRDAYGEDGKLLPVHLWPDALLACVKSIRADGSVTLHDSLRASELMAQAGGKLKAGSLTITFDHAKYLGAEPPEE